MMKALYVTSVESFSGKTAFCLALGKHLQSKGLRLGYLKPLSTQPWRLPDGTLGDEDATFVRTTLGLEAEPSSLAPVVVTDDALRRYLKDGNQGDLIASVDSAAKRQMENADVLLIEGGASLREGYALGLSNPSVAQHFASPALVLVKYRGEMQVVDDALTAQFRLGDLLMGVILNHIPEAARTFVDDYAIPFIQQRGIPVLGSLPAMPRLAALSLQELVDLLEADVLTQTSGLDALADTFTVGAMNAEAALARFRRQQHKVVITGGDRTDIQLAALETSTVGLILTGNLRPSPMVLQQAEALDVPVLLVKENTIETVESIERTFGKTRLGQTEKLDTFVQLVQDRVDLGPVHKALGI
jgi:BioD-like phosphotransacetylase family protein